MLQRPSDRPVTPPGFGQPFAVQDPTGNHHPFQQLVTAGARPLPPITLQPQQGQGGLPPITLQPGVTNQPGGLPPITLVPVGAAAGQRDKTYHQEPIPGQIRPRSPGRPPGGAAGRNPDRCCPPGFRIDPNGQLVPKSSLPGLPGNPGQPTGIPGSRRHSWPTDGHCGTRARRPRAADGPAARHFEPAAPAAATRESVRKCRTEPAAHQARPAPR